MSERIFARNESSKRCNEMTMEEWIEENIFFIHECNYSKDVQKIIQKQIYTRCSADPGDDYFYITSLGDKIELNRSPLTLKINNIEIYKSPIL